VKKLLTLEIGMGADVHGHDYTKAAVRAVSDAIRHSSLTLFYSYGHPDDMDIELTIAVPSPEQIDEKEVAKALPYGNVAVRSVLGGLNDTGMGGAEDIVLANALVKVWLDTSNHRLQLV
jgi:uncharacterized protein (TIGR02058 family)